MSNTSPANLDKDHYHAVLRKELNDLEFAQALKWSEYKQERINRLRDRLGLPVD